MSTASAIGGRIPSGWLTLASGSGSGQTTGVLVAHDTALVRSIDLRGATESDGEAWVVLLFGLALFLAASVFFFIWLQERTRRRLAVATPRPVPSVADADQVEPYPA